MKVDIDEVFFLKNAVSSVQIKASDAPVVAKILDKLDKEFVRLQKLLEKQRETA